MFLLPPLISQHLLNQFNKHNDHRMHFNGVLSHQNQSNHDSQSEVRKKMKWSHWEPKVKQVNYLKCEKHKWPTFISLGFESDWLREWHKFSGPITEWNKAKSQQPWITFDTQFKIALSAMTTFLQLSITLQSGFTRIISCLDVSPCWKYNFPLTACS